MKNSLLQYLLCFAFSLPLLFSCSTTKEYYSFGPAAGKFQGAKAEKKSDKVISAETELALVITANEKHENSVATASEMAATASVNPTPDADFNSVQAKINAATIEEKAHKTSAEISENQTKKLSLVQKLALKKVQKMVKKAGDNKMKANASEKPGLLNKLMLDQNLKLALIFLVAAVIGGIFSWLLGTILLIIALVFLILWILTL